MRPRAAAIAALGAAFLAASAPAPAADDRFTLVDALEELSDLEQLQRPPNPPRQFLRFSSADPNGGTFDAGNFARIEGQEHVLVDLRGAGLLTRLWVSEAEGILRFYWDGAERPQWTTNFGALLAGAESPVTEPFVVPTGEGALLRFPFPFARGLKVTLEVNPDTRWSADAALFPPDTPAASWWPSLGPPTGGRRAYTDAAVAWEDPQSAPTPGRELGSQSIALMAGSSDSSFVFEQDMLITEIVLLHDPAQGIPGNLNLSVDGEQGFQAPWGDLIGQPAGSTPIPGLLHGANTGTGWFRIPFLIKAGSAFTFTLQHPGLEDEFIGTVALRGITLEASSPTAAPELVVQEQEGILGMGGQALALAGHPETRWLTMHAEASSTGGPGILDADLRAGGFLSDPGLMNLLNLEEKPKRPGNITALDAVTVTEDTALRLAGWTTFWPGGALLPGPTVLHSELNAAPGAVRFVAVGQRFTSASLPSAPPVAQRWTDAGQDWGAVAWDSEGILKWKPPVEALARPLVQDLLPGGEAGGTFVVNIASESAINHLQVRLDLPVGWSGTLQGWGEAKNVNDLGWPAIERWAAEIPRGESTFTWTARPPDQHRGGPTIVQPGIIARWDNGHKFWLKRPVELNVDPRGDILHEVGEAGLVLLTESQGKPALMLPKDYIPQPGDQFILEVATTPAPPEDPLANPFAEAALAFPADERQSNTSTYPPGLRSAIPPPGISTAPLRRGTTDLVAFPVASTHAWMRGTPAIGIAFPGLEANEWELLAARMERRPRLPWRNAWSRRLPYEELQDLVFRLPDTVALLEGEDLLLAAQAHVHAPGSEIVPDLRSARLLENVVAAPLGFRIADTPQRDDSEMAPSRGLLFTSRYVGERFRIKLPELQGHRLLGLQFGYGPRSGTVAVRDCEGRLVLVQDLFFPQPATFPQYHFLELEVPSRDPWFYVEVYSESPGSLGNRISLHKAMVPSAFPEVIAGSRGTR